MDRNLARGLFLAALSLAFGLGALRYPIGRFANAGPGLFPLMVASLLLVIALVMIVQSRFVQRAPLHFNFKNIALLLVSLVGFSIVSRLVDMIAGIVFMVFVSALAGSSSYSWIRNAKIAAGLIAVAFAFQKLLGLNLPLV